MIAKCSCQHCGEYIEFESDDIAEENSIMPCPHCGVETKISVPPIPSSQPSIQPFQTEEDYAEGMKWCFKGAKLGDVQSMSFLGASYLEGVGVPKNYTEAVKWLRRAAEQGDIIALGNLGVCYFHGYGVTQNFGEAEKLIRNAAEQGDATAQYHLGGMYYLGQGLPQNSLKGFDWWLKAAEQGHAGAQNNVSFIYRHGEIIDQDNVEAYKWSSLAAAQGFEDADKDADAIALKMSAAQLEESRRRIATFKPKNTDQKESYDDRLIARLARLGDLESQAIVLAKANPEAAAELWTQAMELDNGELIHMRRAISSEVRREVWRRDEGKCVKCGSRERLEYDHIIPVSKGGSNTARNIELLCESCNRTKSASIQ